MCRRKEARLYQELAQTMEALMREHKAYKRQRKAIVDAINELAEQVEEHEAILEEIYTYLASQSRQERSREREAKRERKQKRQEPQRCQRCTAKMHRCKRCGR